MPITFTGDTLSNTERVLTGSESFDWALADSLGNRGFPLRSLTEVYGPKGLGKTSFMSWVKGRVATTLHKNITFLDLEIQNRETIEKILANSGFDGEVHYITSQKDETPEETLERFTDRMFVADPDVGMVDSLGAFYPNSTLEGDIGDRNVGQKAFEIGQFCFRLIRALQIAKTPTAVAMTNHQHPTFGSMIAGQETSGGVTKKFLSHVRIDLKRAFLGTSVVDFGTSWLIKGRIDNNRFGYQKREFHVFMVGGEGVHLGLSAMWDCVVAGHAELSSKKPTEATTVSMDGQSFGKLGILLRDRNTEPQKFLPFINKLKEMQNETQSLEDDEEEEDKPKRKGKKKK